jgi:DNA-binding beta-propeller fold protein YncE
MKSLVRFGCALALLLLYISSYVSPVTRSSTSTARATLGSALPAQSAEVSSVRRINFAANDLVVDPNTQTIYASVPSTAGQSGNSIAAINPATGDVGAHVFLGSDPGKMAVTDDGKFVYVVLEGAGAVRRFDIQTQSAGPQFSLGNDSFDGPFFARSLSVAPGNSGTFAVFRLAKAGGFSGNVAVFDDGVQRAATFRLAENAAAVAFGTSASKLYSYAPLPRRLTRMTLAPSGVASSDNSTLASGPTVDTIKFDGGRLYTGSGMVIDPEAGTIIGSFQHADLKGSSPFVVDAEAGRAYYVTTPTVTSPIPPATPAPTNTYTIRAFDLTTFQPVGTLELPGVSGNPSGLVRWGANGLALSTTGGQLFLIQTTLVPSSEPVPSPTPTPAPTPTPSPTPSPETFVRQLTLHTKDLVYAPSTQLIYASVPSSAGQSGNSITPVDPSTGAVGQATFVGSEPGQLALTDDGQHIYVAFTGASAVRRFDIASQTAGPQITLVNNLTGAGADFANDIETVPGSPGSLAVSASGLTVYDDGVRRPKIGPGSFISNATIEYSDSPARIYGAQSNAGGYDLRKLSVDATGVTLEQTFTNLLGSGDIAYDRGRLYASSRVFDPETGTLLATFRLIDSTSPSAAGCSRGSFLPDPSTERIYYLCNDGTPFDSTARIKAFDMRTFVPLGTITIAGMTGDPGKMVRWGANGLAFRTATNQLFLVQSTLVSAAEPMPTPSPMATPTPPQPTPTPTPGPGELRQITLATRDLVVDPNTQTIYASVPSSAGASGNSLTPIDPFAGTAGPPVAVGSEPGPLAISDNGQYIYIGLNGEHAVRRFDVATGTAGLKFGLGADPQFGPFGSDDIAVAPGQPGTVAVSRTRPVSPRHGGVVIYDDGVPRPVTTPSHTGSNRIEFSSSPSVLYGQNVETTEFGFRKMAVASCGVSTASVIQHAFLTSDFRIAGGLSYTVGGRVYNPEDGTIAGTFIGGGGPVVPDLKAGRVYFIQTGGGQFATLRVFDANTYLPLGELRITGISSLDVATSLVRWGEHGLAFNTGTKVFLIENALIGGTAATQPLPAPTPPTPTFTARGRVAVFGGGTADGVTLNVTGALTASLTTDASGNYSLGGIPPCSVPLTITPSKPDYVFIPPSLTVNDLSAINNLNFNAVLKSVGFARTAVNVSEAAGKVQLVVTRLADISQPASVFYETVPGTASDRSDFNTTIGTLSFASGEASKTITVLLGEDALVEGPETFTVVLKDPSGVLLNPLAATSNITIVDNDTAPPATHPLEDARFFVRQHYVDFLNREPDAGGLVFWVNGIESCGADAQCLLNKRVDTSAAFFLSIEFQETGFLVHRTYKAAYGDADGTATVGGVPTAIKVPVVRLKEFLPDTQRLGQNVIVGTPGWPERLAANKAAFAQEFVTRARFTNAFPSNMTPAEFVDKLITNAGITIETAERQAIVNELADNNTPAGRATALSKIAEHPEMVSNETNKAFVLMQYFGYLRRNPNDSPDANHSGYNFWLGKLNQFGGDFRQAQMVFAFIDSIEYRNRFAP